MLLRKKGFFCGALFCFLVLSLLPSCGVMRGNDADVVEGVQVSAANPQEYVVKTGDTLYSIAFSADKDFRVLALINHLEPPFRIHSGDVLMLKSHAKIMLPNPTPMEKEQIELMEPRIVLLSSKPENPIKSNKSETIVNNHIKKSPQVKKNPKVFRRVTDNQVHTRNVWYSRTHKKAKRNLANVVSKKPVIHWQWPAKGKVVDAFSLSQLGNKGLDIRGKYGSPVRATAPGVVVYSGSGLRGYGNLIIIKHNARFLSAYAYNKKLLVREGVKVKVGQRIATMGRVNSGQVRLHFEIRRAGRPVDPRCYLG